MRKERMETIEKKILCSKMEYDSMEIPGELHQMVSETVNAERGKRRGVKMKNHRIARTAAAAAALFICFTAGLNASPAFAAVMKDVPVLGAVSKILTFRTYDYEDQDMKVHGEIPQIQETEGAGTEAAAGTGTEAASNAGAEAAMSAEETVSLERTVNEEINRIMDQYKEDAKQRIEDYKEAFLATGGTAEEFAQKGIRVDAGYEVYFESEDRLSFAILANENWCSAYGLRLYYNLDLKNGRTITLEDLLGEDYIEIANRAIREQMKKNMEQDKSLVYWGGDMGGFTTVDSDAKFYINEKGNPVVVFDKYEIAPGAFGVQEFEISGTES